MEDLTEESIQAREESIRTREEAIRAREEALQYREKAVFAWSEEEYFRTREESVPKLEKSHQDSQEIMSLNKSIVNNGDLDMEIEQAQRICSEKMRRLTLLEEIYQETTQEILRYERDSFEIGQLLEKRKREHDILCSKLHSEQRIYEEGVIARQSKIAETKSIFDSLVSETRQSMAQELQGLTEVLLDKIKPVIHQLQGIETESDYRECPICLTRKKIWSAFIPCGHGVCSDCCPNLSDCHQCRKSIEDMLTIYF